ncbi:MAG: PAAR domain-containing protein [Planctomycetaceae bacterium]|nr:PAAR domain-containing protein [Planctomycetaceae bacterium]
MPPAARILDMVSHPLPPMLTPGPGAFTVLIGKKPAWRGVPAAVAGALSAAKTISDTAIKTAEAATLAAAGTPGAPAAKLAEEAAKASAAASMGAAISSAAGMSDIHACTTPLPIPPHGPGVVIDGSPTVLINNLPACRQGDTILEAVGPPNKISMGCFNVFIGSSGGGGGGGGGAAAGAAAPGGLGSIGKLPVTKLPNGDIQVGKAITITGDDAFKQKTLAHLGQIAATDNGNDLLQAIDSSGKQLTIQESGDGTNSTSANPATAYRNADGTAGSGSDSTVDYNPDRTTLRDPGEASTADNAWKDRPPAVGLAHELVHVYQAANGEWDSATADNDGLVDPADPSKKAQETIDELQAAGIPPHDTYPYTENKIRDQWSPKQPQRPYY